MPQSALPDLNTKFIIYTREAINGWKNHNYDSAIGSLYAFNGLLPDTEPGKYRVIVDTNEYNKRTKQDLVVICKSCSKECRHCKGESKEPLPCSAEYSYDKMKIVRVLQPLVKRTVSGVEYDLIWLCPLCKAENELGETEMIQKILKDPSFISVVPKPPTRKDGIIDRSQFHAKFTVWFWTFLTELEASAARFRQEYKPKDGDQEEYVDNIESTESRDEQNGN